MPVKIVEIKGRKIGPGCPCYFMAEIGGAYADFGEAKRLIDSARRIGVEAIKFQTYEANTITTKDNMFDMNSVGRISQYELFKRYEPDKGIQRQIARYSKSAGMTSFTAPSHLKDLELIEELHPLAYKIGSDLACHIPLLRKIAESGKPIVLSTGMCTIDEVRESVDAIRNEGNDNIVLLHCVSDYPAKPEDANLRVIRNMQDEFQIPVGFSDHATGPEISIAAVAMGANVIERHFRHESNMKGPDYLISSDEKEYEFIISAARKIEAAFGDGIKRPTRREEKNKKTNRVSIITMKDIEKGTRIEEDMIDVRRPGTGIEPKHFFDVVGKKAKTRIRKETALKWSMIE